MRTLSYSFVATVVDIGETVTLFRAVAHEEALDIRMSGRFRLGSGSSYVDGKWFAMSFAHAVRWGQELPPAGQRRPFLVAQVSLPVELVSKFFRLSRLDGIGPAVFVHLDELQLINSVGAISLVHIDPVEKQP